MSPHLRRALGLLGAVLALASGAVTAELTRAAAPARVRAPVLEGVAPNGLIADHAGPAPEAPIAIATGTPPPAPIEDVPPVERLRSLDAASSNLRGGRIIGGGTAHRLILFTFDDGPDARYTRPLLDALDEAQVRAVFFLTTRRFAGPTPYERNLAAIAREIAARGHHVGSHSMDHVQLPLVPSPELRVQIDESAEILERELGAIPALIRPPGGSRSPRIDGYLGARGYTQVLWNLGTGDVQVRSADAVLDTFVRVLESRERHHGERGGVVLLHDIHAWSVEAFPRIVAYLDRRNCDLLAAGEELFDFADDPALFYDARRDGDEDDALARPSLADDLLEARQVRARARAEERCADRDALDRRIAGE